MPTLVDALLAAVDSNPDQVAIRSGAAGLSYADLLAAAARLGHRLREAGVQPGDRVALALPNTPAYAVAHYATLMAGAVVVPLNPKHDGPALTGRLHDAAPRALVVHGEPAAVIAGAARAAGVDLVELAEPSAGTQAIGPHPVADDDPALITYKSGDDAQPHGVVLSHRALAWSANAAADVLGLSADDTLASYFPLFYPLGQTYGLGAAVASGCGLMIPAATDAASALPSAAEAGATVFGTFPILAGQTLGADSGARRDGWAVRTVFCSGGRSLASRVRDRIASSLGCEVIEGYGPVETAALACAGRAGQPSPAGSIGPAVPGVDLAVVDGRGRAAPVRKAGRLLARGPNVMSGYWGRQKDTARAFDSGWLLTGDKARKDEDGNVYLLDGLLWTDPLRGRESGRRRLLKDRR